MTMMRKRVMAAKMNLFRMTHGMDTVVWTAVVHLGMDLEINTCTDVEVDSEGCLEVDPEADPQERLENATGMDSLADSKVDSEVVLETSLEADLQRLTGMSLAVDMKAGLQTDLGADLVVAATAVKGFTGPPSIRGPGAPPQPPAVQAPQRQADPGLDADAAARLEEIRAVHRARAAAARARNQDGREF